MILMASTCLTPSIAASELLTTSDPYCPKLELRRLAKEKALNSGNVIEKAWLPRKHVMR